MCYVDSICLKREAISLDAAHPPSHIAFSFSFSPSCILLLMFRSTIDLHVLLCLPSILGRQMSCTAISSELAQGDFGKDLSATVENVCRIVSGRHCVA